MCVLNVQEDRPYSYYVYTRPLRPVGALSASILPACHRVRWQFRQRFSRWRSLGHSSHSLSSVYCHPFYCCSKFTVAVLSAKFVSAIDAVLLQKISAIYTYSTV